MDLSTRLLLVVRREFKFSVDIGNQQHIAHGLSKSIVESYAEKLTDLLKTKGREVFKLLMKKNQTMHREYKNHLLASPKKFRLGGISFANLQVQFNSKLILVQQLEYSRHRLYEIIKVQTSGHRILSSHIPNLQQ